jgi:hypothetical protein
LTPVAAATNWDPSAEEATQDQFWNGALACRQVNPELLEVQIVES